MSLIDLQKAFDTMDHNILLLKMLSLEVSREVTEWYESYLSNRKFYVNVHDKFSTSADLRCGVPEGPIRKSLLFLLYKRYAASCFYFSTQMIYVCYSNIKKELTKKFSNICGWIVDNKLSIHFGEDKTKSMCFSTKNRKRKNWNFWHTIWWGQNQEVLKSNILRLWVRGELVGRGYGFESCK